MTLAQTLAGYRPRTGGEAADLARVRALTGDPWDRAAALHVTGSALIVHPATGRVLLRWHQRQSAWLQVGGHGDPGEDAPLAVALREGTEETGLTDLVPFRSPEPVHLVVVPVAGNDREPAHEHADLRYVLATAQPDRARPEHPDAPVRWLSLPEAYDLVTEPNLRETLDRLTGLLGTTIGAAGPTIEDRSAQPYVGRRRRVTMTTIAEIADRIPELFGWLAARGLPPSGPPFLRYHVTDMAGHLDVEAGVPVAEPVPGDGDVRSAVLPAGRYATATHVGHYDGLAAATGGLLGWAEQQGLALDVTGTPDGEAWGCRLEIYETNPAEVPDPAKWETTLAFRLAD